MLRNQNDGFPKVLDRLPLYLAKSYSCAEFHCQRSIKENNLRRPKCGRINFLNLTQVLTLLSFGYEQHVGKASLHVQR